MKFPRKIGHTSVFMVYRGAGEMVYLTGNPEKRSEPRENQRPHKGGESARFFWRLLRPQRIIHEGREGKRENARSRTANYKFHQARTFRSRYIYCVYVYIYTCIPICYTESPGERVNPVTRIARAVARRYKTRASRARRKKCYIRGRAPARLPGNKPRGPRLQQQQQQQPRKRRFAKE